MSGGITVKEFKHIPGVNDAEYIKKLEELNEIDKGIISKAVAKIKMLSAQPERKTGRWIYGESEVGNDGYYCSECGNFVPWIYEESAMNFIREYKFCPNCGAKMERGK